MNASQEPNANDPLERLAAVSEQAEREVLEATTVEQIEALRVSYLGRKAELTQILRSVSELPAEQRAEVGKRGNEARKALEALIDERAADARGGRAGHRAWRPSAST